MTRLTIWLIADCPALSCWQDISAQHRKWRQKSFSVPCKYHTVTWFLIFGTLDLREAMKPMIQATDYRKPATIHRLASIFEQFTPFARRPIAQDSCTLKATHSLVTPLTCYIIGYFLLTSNCDPFAFSHSWWSLRGLLLLILLILTTHVSHNATPTRQKIQYERYSAYFWTQTQAKLTEQTSSITSSQTYRRHKSTDRNRDREERQKDKRHHGYQSLQDKSHWTSVKSPARVQAVRTCVFALKCGNAKVFHDFVFAIVTSFRSIPFLLVLSLKNNNI